MATEFREFHIVDEDTIAAHTLNGPNCVCEPRCVMAMDTARVFLHDSSRLKLKLIRHKQPPKWWAQS